MTRNFEGRDRSYDDNTPHDKNSLSARGRYGPDAARWLARELQKRRRAFTAL